MSWGKVVVGERELIRLLFAFRVFCNSCSDQTPLRHETSLLVSVLGSRKALFMYKIFNWVAFLPLHCSLFSAVSCGFSGPVALFPGFNSKKFHPVRAIQLQLRKKICSHTLLSGRLQGGLRNSWSSRPSVSTAAAHQCGEPHIICC